MDIFHSRNPLTPLLLTNPRINLRQRRRTKRIVIIQQQFQARDNCNRKTPFFKRRRFCFQILERSRNADVNCAKYTISVLYLRRDRMSMYLPVSTTASITSTLSSTLKGVAASACRNPARFTV
jgi:hypothetical protein